MIRIALLTALTMVAFAANSLLCRIALGEGLIDAASFASVRVISGFAALSLILLFCGQRTDRTAASWRVAAILSIYMVFFSFAYVSLDTGTGALILFGAVQLTMFGVALHRGERFSLISWGGLALAIIGLIYLLAPGARAPEPLGAVLMDIAGIAWGLYSLAGRGMANPLETTAQNFRYAVPLVLIVAAFFWRDFNTTSTGLTLAIALGAIASGCGYAIWYTVLPALTATRAATVQLTVPAIAAVGGVLFLSEQVSVRLLLAFAAIMVGVLIVLAQRASDVSKTQ